MHRKLLKLPVFTFIGGFILHIFNFFIQIFGYGINFNPTMDKMLSYSFLSMSIIIIIIIGLVLRKTYSRKDFFLSASLLVVYTIILSIIQRITFQFDLYNFTFDFILYLPIAIFGVFRYFSVIYNDSTILSLLFATFSILEPYVFLIFGKSLKAK